jgi:transmembrane sensor
LPPGIPHEELTEIVLVEGGINLFQGDYHTTKKDIIQLNPGEKAICLESENKLALIK